MKKKARAFLSNTYEVRSPLSGLPLFLARIKQLIIPTLILFLIVFTDANAALVDGKYSAAQVFDSQRSPAFPSAGTSFTASSFKRPYSNITSSQYDIGAGQYVQFFYVGGPCTGDNIGLKLFNSNGTVDDSSFTDGIVSSGGAIWGLGSQGFLHNSAPGGYGTFISNDTGFSLGNSYTYTPITAKATCGELDAYAANGTPLNPGQGPGITTFTVTFDLAGGTRTGGGALTQTVNQGEGATAPTLTPPTGKVFSQWSAAFNNITQTTTITAQYQDATYTVTFNLAGGTRTGGGDLSQTVVHGQSATAPTLTPPIGNVFSQWSAAFDNITQATTITAQYRAATYTVTFDLNGGTYTGGAALTQTVIYGNSALAPTMTPPDGKVFTQWNMSLYNITQSKTITAQYEDASYTVTFDLAGGSHTGGGALSQTVTHGNGAQAPTVEAPPGKTFIGWSAALTPITANTTLVAQYQARSYQVTFDLGGGTLISGSQLLTVDHGQPAVAPEVQAPEGKVFQGWDQTFTAITADLTITAQYTDRYHQVIFELGAGARLGGGTLSQQIPHSQAALAPTVRPPAGYIFSGWNVPFNTITADLQVEAIYTPSPSDETPPVTVTPPTQTTENGVTVLRTEFENQDGQAHQVGVSFDAGSPPPDVQTMDDGSNRIHFNSVGATGEAVDTKLTILPNGATTMTQECALNESRISSHAPSLSVEVGNQGQLALSGTFTRPDGLDARIDVSTACGEPVRVQSTQLSAARSAQKTQELSFAMRSSDVALNQDGQVTIRGGRLTDAGEQVEVILRVNLNGEVSTTIKPTTGNPTSVTVTDEADVQVNSEGGIGISRPAADQINLDIAGNIDIVGSDGQQQSRLPGSTVRVTGDQVLNVDVTVSDDQRNASVSVNAEGNEITSRLEVDPTLGNFQPEIGDDVDGHKIVRTGEDGSSLSLQVRIDGSVEHRHRNPNSSEETVAVSHIPGATSRMEADGSLTTHLSYNNTDVSLTTDLQGQTEHRIGSSQGTARAQSFQPGAHTDILTDESGNALVVMRLEQPGRAYRITGHADGSASHELTTPAVTSEAHSSVPGTETEISDNGDVNTVAPTADGQARAYVRSAASGETQTGFARYNADTDQWELMPTLRGQAPFAATSNTEIRQRDDGELELEVNIRTARPIQF